MTVYNMTLTLKVSPEHKVWYDPKW